MNCPWPASSEAPDLGDGSVHVWYLPLDVDDARLNDLAQSLSDDEHARAARYRFDNIRNRFIACRGQVRAVLSRYIDESPGQVEFQYANLGKPSLGERWRDSNLEFNVSHSGDAGMLAIARGRVVGVDVEQVRGMSDVRGLIGRYFARSEQEVLAELSGDTLLNGFFRIWTSKEAILKATSMGLSIAPEKVEVRVVDTNQPCVIQVDDKRSPFDSWWLHPLDIGSDYVAALASPGQPAKKHLSVWAG